MLISVAKGLSLVKADYPNKYPYCICMLIEGRQKALIDFGAGIRAFSDIKDKKAIDLGLITHYHPDHIHCSPLFDSTPMYAAKEELGAYQSEKEFMKMGGIDFWPKFMANTRPPTQKDIMLDSEDIPINSGFIKLPIAGQLFDGQKFDLGKGLRFSAIHLPGHTVGHYGFYFEKDGILFSGDIDMTRAGPFYGNACSNVGQFIDSIRRIQEIDPGTIITSHRGVIKEGIKKTVTDYLQILLDREQIIYEKLKHPHSIEQLAEYQIIFKERLIKMEEFWEKISIYHHILHLMETGAIKEVEKDIFQQV